MSIGREAQRVLNTLRLLAQSQLGYNGRKAAENVSNSLLRTLIAAEPIQRPFASQNNHVELGANSDLFDSPSTNPDYHELPSAQGLSPAEEEFLVRAANTVGVQFAAPTTTHKASVTTHQATAAVTSDAPRDQIAYDPSLPEGYVVKDNLMEANPLGESRARKVPSSRLSRFANFGMLAVGLGSGAAAEATRRAFGSEKTSSSSFITPANAERIVSTLCRVRGAALKIGQMLSLQDETMVPPYLLEIFERVRQGADFMPISQVDAQMTAELGGDWRSKFGSFEERPFAAASIGQVHKATTLDGKDVAVKIQYPGVAAGIDADIDNLVSILGISGLLPKGMFIDEFVVVARRELKAECDYVSEANFMSEFRRLLSDDTNFYVPSVVEELSSKCVLTAEFIEGKPLDKCVDEPQAVRDWISRKFIELCLREIFDWRLMQTDPNWSNFFLGVHPETRKPKLILLDFGASQRYTKHFSDLYMRILKSAYDEDRETMIDYSRKIGFLTGYESKVMEDAHCDSISILGETLASKKPYDFSRQNVTQRIQKLIPVMLEHRLSAPPDEVYSLHRKLAGAYLLATKLKATVSCGPLFYKMYSRYEFDPASEKARNV